MKKYLSVGYPLGGSELNEKLYYVIETQGKYIYLNAYEVIAWTNILSQYELPSEFDAVIERLVAVGTVVEADNLNNLLTYTMKFRSFRQGVAVAAMNDNKAYEILIGDSMVPVSYEQLKIWRLSDGKTTISTIYEKIVAQASEEVSILQEESFIQDIQYLISKGILYLI